MYEYSYGDGIDFINGFNSNDTLQIYNSTYSTMISGDDFLVLIGEGIIDLKNSANISVKIKDACGYLTAYNNNPLNLLQGTDSIDVITNTSKNATVLGYAGNDDIWNYVDNVVIYGGNGHDKIVNHGNKVSISGGAGNDSIQGFRADSTLEIGDGTGIYATQTSGNDIIVYVGDGSISLVGAASLEEVNIAGVESELPAWRLNGTTATYGTSTNAQITINGVKSLDGISLSGKVVTIANSALNRGNVTITNGYSLVFADDVTTPKTTAAGWSLSGTIAIYKNSSTSAGYQLSNNQISYTTARR